MKRAVILLLVALMLITFTASVSAQHSLQFNATRVYWDSDYRLAIEGFFKNTGTDTITGITHFDLTLYYEHRYTGEYLPLGEGFWDHNPELARVKLSPDQTSRWTFYLKTNKMPNFVYWKYRWYSEYTYLAE